jgi:hypothetical protein
MKNEKGISKLVLLLIVALIIIAAISWAKYFAQPMATVMMGGADQARPAIEKAQKASDAVDKVNQITQEVERKANEAAAK